jgi:hypothetical protein
MPYSLAEAALVCGLDPDTAYRTLAEVGIVAPFRDSPMSEDELEALALPPACLPLPLEVNTRRVGPVALARELGTDVTVVERANESIRGILSRFACDQSSRNPFVDPTEPPFSPIRLDELTRAWLSLWPPGPQHSCTVCDLARFLGADGQEVALWLRNMGEPVATTASRLPRLAVRAYWAPLKMLHAFYQWQRLDNLGRSDLLQVAAARLMMPPPRRLRPIDAALHNSLRLALRVERDAYAQEVWASPLEAYVRYRFRDGTPLGPQRAIELLRSEPSYSVVDIAAELRSEVTVVTRLLRFLTTPEVEEQSELPYPIVAELWPCLRYSCLMRVEILGDRCGRGAEELEGTIRELAVRVNAVPSVVSTGSELPLTLETYAPELRHLVEAAVHHLEEVRAWLLATSQAGVPSRDVGR